MKEVRRFYLIFCSILITYSVIAFYRHHGLLSRIFGGVGVGLILLHFLAPAVSETLYRLQRAVLSALGGILTKIFMCVFFCAIFSPYGILLRWLQGDPLHRRKDSKKTSYWIERKAASLEDSEKFCRNPY